MSDGVLIDTSGLLKLASDVGDMGDKLKILAVSEVKSSSERVVKQMKADASQSKHFSKMASRITAEQKVGQTFAEAELGPHKRGAGNLAVIAYFGVPGWGPGTGKTRKKPGKGWRAGPGGGGTLTDPDVFLQAEGKELADAVGALLGGLL